MPGGNFLDASVNNKVAGKRGEGLGDYKLCLSSKKRERRKEFARFLHTAYPCENIQISVIPDGVKVLVFPRPTETRHPHIRTSGHNRFKLRSGPDWRLVTPH